MTQIEKLEKIVKEWEDKAAKMGEESSFCRNRNFNIEAQILYDKKRLVDDFCMDIRLKVIEELISA
jgi:hypothetical protein